MYICYADESGSGELLTASKPDATPVFVLAGVSVPIARSRDVVWDFLNLKRAYQPMLQVEGCSLVDLIKTEVKGANLRADFRQTHGARNRRRAAERFMGDVLSVLERHRCRVAGTVVVKPVDDLVNETSTYTGAVQELARTFNSQLAAAQTEGVMVLDARTKVKNVSNVHSITTWKYRTGGDPVPHLVEAPVFGHSDTHVPLQIADLVASALVFPMACAAYCEDLTWSSHAHPNYAKVQDRFGERLRALEYRYANADGATRGGFHTIDRRRHRPSRALFGGS